MSPTDTVNLTGYGWLVATEPEPHGWTLKRSDGTQKPLNVPARTQEQRDRSKRNLENPAPPSGFKRHGQLESLR